MSRNQTSHFEGGMNRKGKDRILFSQDGLLSRQAGQVGFAYRGLNLCRPATQTAPGLNVPDDVKMPATPPDYAATKACTSLLSNGLFRSTTPQFLYCSIIVPHPPYRTNATYLNKLPSLGNQSVPNFRPRGTIHPSDEYTMKVKESYLTDQVPADEIGHFRRVYFSMCIEASELMGRVLDALESGGGSDNTFVIFVSDHGEHATENRQCGKNSMLEASARVPFVIAGPGIRPGQTFPNTLASLSDLYPTVLDMAGLTSQGIQNHVGESLLPVVQGRSKTKRDNFITSEYHSVYSGTGIFMVRRADLKLVVFAPVHGDSWAPQLFNLTSDPWEHANLAAQQPETVTELRQLVEAAYDNTTAADLRKKDFDKFMFEKFWYDKQGGANGCIKAMMKVYKGFDPKSDVPKVEQWLGKPCK
eukprot:m.35605 g.35605  ORF g.35605 m.35605 type:complete len:416 (+) comp10936_c0_seq2:720-1967(+)